MSNKPRFQIGETVRIVATCISTETGAHVNPTTVAIKVRAPDGTETEYTGGQLSNPEIGVFTYDLTVTQDGVYAFRMVCSGNVSAVAESFIRVPPTLFEDPL